jgi:exportin-1
VDKNGFHPREIFSHELQNAWYSLLCLALSHFSSHLCLVSSAALGVLDVTVKTRWKSLPAKQSAAVKEYLIKLILKLSEDSNNLTNKEMSRYMKRLNLVLVQIVKQDWPENWQGFIGEIVSSSKKSQSLCANNMNILLLLR